MTATALAAVGSNANENGTLLISGTAVSASGTAVNFTDIPSWAKRITVMINGLSYAAAGVGVVRIGSGSLLTTGYTSNTLSLTIGETSPAAQTNGFGSLSTSVAASTINGIFTLFLVTGNTWAFTELAFRTTDNVGITGNGSIALSGALDRLSLVATTSTFDAGTINIMWE
jgi:hypothetical protein